MTRLDIETKKFRVRFEKTLVEYRQFNNLMARSPEEAEWIVKNDPTFATWDYCCLEFPMDGGPRTSISVFDSDLHYKSLKDRTSSFNINVVSVNEEVA